MSQSTFLSGQTDTAAAAKAAPDTAQPVDLPQDFESALHQLETLVARMEDGALPLEQSLTAYQQGVALAQHCQSLLDKAEEQVKVLQGSLLVAQGADTDIGGLD